MTDKLNIVILPERSMEEPSPDDCIMANYPGSLAREYLEYYPCNMAEIIVVTAWNVCRTWPCGATLDMDKMLSRKRLYSLNGKDC